MCGILRSRWPTRSTSQGPASTSVGTSTARGDALSGPSHQTAEANRPEQSGPPIPAPAVPTLVPADEHNRTLLHNVHPPDWRNPEPAPRYNLVVIGAGTAGLVTAAGAARLGVPLRDGAAPDFGAVMERMRRLRARISHHDSAERFQRELRVDVFLGDARFTGPDTVAVGGRT